MLRELLKFILPKGLSQRIEEESKTWLIICKCGFYTNYREAGGIRAGASARKKKIPGYCPKCKKFRFFEVRKNFQDAV